MGSCGAPATSTPGLGSPLPNPRRDWAHPCHIRAGTRLAPPTSAPGLGPPLPHLRRDSGHRTPQVSVLSVRKGTLDLGKPPPPPPAQSLSTAPLVARTRNGGVGYSFPKVRSIRFHAAPPLAGPGRRRGPRRSHSRRERASVRACDGRVTTAVGSPRRHAERTSRTRTAAVLAPAVSRRALPMRARAAREWKAAIRRFRGSAAGARHRQHVAARRQRGPVPGNEAPCPVGCHR
jgi:hypothetical protein